MHEFLITGSGGYFPQGRLLQASDGKLYGTTASGGMNFGGVVFRMNLGGAFEVVWNMGAEMDARYSWAGLIQASDGRLYGASAQGGEFNKGTVFSVGLDGSHAVLHSFSGSDGEQLQAGVIQGSDSSLYGTALSGGSRGQGVVFKLTLGGVLTVLHDFGEDPVDGFWPQAVLVEARDGVFLGVVPFGGGTGMLFQVRGDGYFKRLHQFPDPSFAGVDGSAPSGGLVALPGGEFLGATGSGGANVRGTLYRVRLK